MLFIDWKITLAMTIFLLLNALFLIKTISKTQGVLREKSQKDFYEIINSTFGNFKLIKLQSNDISFARSGIIHESLSHFPRIFLETLGLIAIVVVYLVYKYQTDISSALGILSMFVLGLYRLIPSANRL